MESTKFTLNKEDAIKILKVAGFSIASTALACAMALLAKADVPLQWAWLVPAINTILVALKKFVEGQSVT